MSTTERLTGYEFTDTDRRQLQQMFERRGAASNVGLYLEFGRVGAFACAAVGIDEPSLNAKALVVMIQSWATSTGVIQFGLLAAADRQPLDPNSTYETFLEAIVNADVFLSRFLIGLREKCALKATATNDLAISGNVINSRILSDAEVHYVQTFANELGKVSGLTGFAKFVESTAGVISIALGVLNKDTTIMLGTVVVVTDISGTSCTVRDFQNRPMPGLETYRTIYSALTTTKAPFEKLAQLTAKHLRPTLMQRLFG